MGLTIDNSTLMRALNEVDQRLFAYHGTKIHYTLNVVSGFALLMNMVKVDTDEYTDIDYICPSFLTDVKEIIDKVGIEYGLGKGWINNDDLLDGASLKDIEYITGPLNFKPTLELNVFTINVLDLYGILKMKIIAVDTTQMTVGVTNDFTRARDFKDIRDLMSKLEITTSELKREMHNYVMEPNIFDLIDEFNKTGSNKYT